MKLYNDMTLRLEEFEPIEPGKVKMYARREMLEGDALVGDDRSRDVAGEVHLAQALHVERRELIARPPQRLGLVVRERPERVHEPPGPFEEPRYAFGIRRPLDHIHLLGGGEDQAEPHRASPVQ